LFIAEKLLDYLILNLFP